MIDYNLKATLGIILAYQGTVWPRVLPFCFLTVGLTILVYNLKEADIINITFPIDGHELLATMVAYLVVSRVSASYTRFWEARSLLSIALHAARQLSVQASAFTNKDKSDGANLWRTTVCAVFGLSFLAWVCIPFQYPLCCCPHFFNVSIVFCVRCMMRNRSNIKWLTWCT